MKTTTTLLLGVALIAAFASGTKVRADNLAEAAAKASALVNRPIAASPHALEEFPWLLRGESPPTEATGAAAESAQNAETYPGNLAEAAAKASTSVNRPIAASPHALEEFPWLLREQSPPTEGMGGVAEPAENPGTYPDNLASAAAKASALVNRPILASPHALEEFPWLLRENSQQTARGGIPGRSKRGF